MYALFSDAVDGFSIMPPGSFQLGRIRIIVRHKLPKIHLFLMNFS